MNAEIKTNDAPPRDPDDIERQNDELRADMGRTIQALEQKLSPGQLLDRALGMVKEHGGEWAQNLGGTVKHNPVPTVLTAVGIAWLMSTQNRAAAGYTAERDSSESSRWKERLDSAGERVSSARSRVSGAAHQLGDQASSARARLHDTAESVRHSAHSVADRSRQAKAQLQSTMHEQPLMLGAVGVALGAMLGSLLPATEREDRMMGGARDRTLQKARAAGEQQLEHAREAASHVTESAKRAMAEEQQRPH